MHFGHVLTAMITPFDANNHVDFNTMTTLIEHLIRNGTEGLVITGTTGESSTLSSEEREEIYEHVVNVVNKRVPVLAGTGTNDTKSSIIQTKIASKFGVDGIMLVSPYYNRPNQAGLYEHFNTIANSTDLPIMLYNIPGRTSVYIEPETIIELSKIENIVSVKESNGNLDHITTIIANTPSEFTVYSGDDSMTLPIMAVGGTGVVSVASHIIGIEINKMVKSFIAGNISEAGQLHRELLPIMNALFMSPSPAPVKAALKLKGLDVGSVRLPLVDLTKEEQKMLKQLIIS